MPVLSSTVRPAVVSAIRRAWLISTSSSTPSHRKSGWSAALLETTVAGSDLGGATIEPGPPLEPQDDKRASMTSASHLRNTLASPPADRDRGDQASRPRGPTAGHACAPPKPRAGDATLKLCHITDDLDLRIHGPDRG